MGEKPVSPPVRSADSRAGTLWNHGGEIREDIIFACFEYHNSGNFSVMFLSSCARAGMQFEKEVVT